MSGEDKRNEPEDAEFNAPQTKSLGATFLDGFKKAFAEQLESRVPLKGDKPSLPPIEEEKERPLPNMGFDLIKFFGWILVGYLVCAATLVFWSEYRFTKTIAQLTEGVRLKDLITTGTNAVSEVKLEQIQGITRAVVDAYKDSRSSIVDFHKTIITSIIFPILTALLGYTFAQKQAQRPDQDKH
jgi:hypothetical protein